MIKEKYVLITNVKNVHKKFNIVLAVCKIALARFHVTSVKMDTDNNIKDKMDVCAVMIALKFYNVASKQIHFVPS